MGNLPSVSICPVCDLDADDDDSVGHEFSSEQNKSGVYREGANGVSFRSNLSSCKMIIPTQMLHGREGLRVLGFEYRTVRSGAGGRNGACTRRLHHVATNQIITQHNSRIHIPSCLFSEVTRCCQDIAQDVLLKEGGLERLMVREEDDKIRTVALVTRRSDDDNVTLETCSLSEDGSRSTASEESCRPTLLVISGRGRSRAGIFSRKQLLVSGIEAATALNTVKEGRKRGLNVVLMDHYSQQDPTSQVDTMDAFESSLETIFGDGHEQDESSWHSSSDAFDSSRGPVFVLAHSASGGKLVISLLEGKARRYLLPRICGIVFTDSTHNIQWCSGVQRVWDLLESQKCLYIRSNEVRSSSSWRDGDETRRAGGEVSVDTFWEHRFGTIRTVWAGTADHSLMNVKSADIIWDHFDKLLAGRSSSGGRSDVNLGEAHHGALTHVPS